MKEQYVKKIVLVSGDEYENVTVSKDVPSWIEKNVSDDFLVVKSKTFKPTVLISAEMIVSVELVNKKSRR